ncbi:hypothetical protein KIN20_004708 [Parelaphostrongylus tenuis]|uniref:Uncharacterized protein n=1 Tax=Parelaphostrongylus tenuis TaxID=148309 RepID=A0AAD5MKC0_PARTN|nr:hypothetical protein KIN20_004708 [Parelaphostrongylus tenuis]
MSEKEEERSLKTGGEDSRRERKERRKGGLEKRNRNKMPKDLKKSTEGIDVKENDERNRDARQEKVRERITSETQIG